MNLDQIATRIAQPESCLGTEAPALKELTEKYPFAQVFSILYLKALSNAQDIGFDEALQQHAYRVTDRMKLYDLIHGNAERSIAAGPEQVTLTELVTEPGPGEVSFPEEAPVEETIAAIPETEAEPEATATEASAYEHEGSIATAVYEQEESIAAEATAEETIQTINEATAYDHEELVEAPQEEETLSPETETEAAADTIPEPEAAEPGEMLSVKGAPEFITDDMELEIISQVVATVYNDNLERSVPGRKTEEQPAEEPIEEKNEQPLISRTEDVESGVLESRRSFSSWLKAGNAPESPAEKTVEKAPEQKPKAAAKQVNKIIDQFIEKDPTISRPKKEFYSPTKKAKESISSEGMIYTETLADIFAIQGNFPKAIQAYEQLMLTNPEKKIFFAQRIKELKEKLNT